MLEIQGNLWDFHKEGHPICITTNGFVKKNGECVMGRGIAQQAAKRFPKLPFLLGEAILAAGNQVNRFGEFNLFTFPVKHNWWEAADLKLIHESAIQLVTWPTFAKQIYLPRPGCDNGRLNWYDVKPVLEFMDDRFIICDLKS